MLRQLPVRLVRRGRVGVGEAMPCSRSFSSSEEMVRGTGRAEDEDVLMVSAAWTWMSSSLSSW